jgi:hypothetical protein
LLDKLNQADVNFWKIIGHIGIANERKTKIPLEVVLADGTVVNDVNAVLDAWKNDFENL